MTEQVWLIPRTSLLAGKIITTISFSMLQIQKKEQHKE
jgi:hypothetical protein